MRKNLFYGTSPAIPCIDRCTSGEKISMIGVDFAGIRRGKEHTPKDQYCADRGVFVVENLCGLSRLLVVPGSLLPVPIP